MRYLTQLLSGLIFGFGLALAGMTSPQKVLAFLDVSNQWDPSLLVVLGSAVAIAAVAFRWTLKRSRPVLESQFHVGGIEGIDRGLIAGSAIFGIGWGIGGYCPGPAVALLAVPLNPEAPIFLGGLLAGIVAYVLLKQANLRGQPQAAEPATTGRDACQ
jgi:uncharacterized membrane protein YedE/YeeE